MIDFILAETKLKAPADFSKLEMYVETVLKTSTTNMKMMDYNLLNTNFFLSPVNPILK